MDEQEKEAAREKFAVAVTFLLLVPLLLMGFFFIVLGLKLEVLDWQSVIMVDAFMTFGYVILWFLVKGYLLKYFTGGKGQRLSDKVRPQKPAKPSIEPEKKESKLINKLFKKEKKEEKKRERWA